MTCRLKLYFNSPKDNKILFTPYAYIYLGSHNVDNKRHLLTSDFTESEIDSQIDYLALELETIRKEAKKKFKHLGK